MSRKWLLLVAVLALGIAFIGCGDGGSTTTYDSGTATGSADGYAAKFENGRPVTVTITLYEEDILGAVVSGPDESVNYGALVIQAAGALIKDKKSVNAGVDAVTAVTPSTGRATYTIQAIKDAGAEAIDKIHRGEFDPS
jgi:hypothetical protein